MLLLVQLCFRAVGTSPARICPPSAWPLADDKTIRMWEYGIQAQAKYIAGELPALSCCAVVLRAGAGSCCGVVQTSRQMCVH